MEIKQFRNPGVCDWVKKQTKKPLIFLTEFHTY